MTEHIFDALILQHFLHNVSIEAVLPQILPMKAVPGKPFQFQAFRA